LAPAAAFVMASAVSTSDGSRGAGIDSANSARAVLAAFRIARRRSERSASIILGGA
jgi:hypothetical protein